MVEETALFYHINERAFEFEQYARRQAVHELNGHFLFNAMTVIMVMTRRAPLCARELEKEFSDYLRGVMVQAGGAQEWIPLSLELSVVRAYLHIQSVRFMGKITFEMEIRNEDALVPAGVLRSLVENAVSHGICRKTDGGYVSIEQEITGSRHCIYVTDNGDGFDINILDPTSQSGIGRARSALEQTKGAGLDIFSTRGCGTQAELILPLILQTKRGDICENNYCG